jgi:hypothetical protein
MEVCVGSRKKASLMVTPENPAFDCAGRTSWASPRPASRGTTSPTTRGSR